MRPDTICTPAEHRDAPSPPPTTSRHGPIAQLLIAWSPLSLILAAYALAHWVNAPLSTGGGSGVNLLGMGVHVSGPADADRALFGVVPSVWLQQRLVDGDPHWYDGLAALVYVTHFVTIPAVTALAWFRRRRLFAPWIVSVITFTVVGMAGYVLFPAAPPWLASQLGEVPALDRISDLGWGFLHLDAVGWLTDSGQAASNPVAAMPSLHAGAALLVVLFLWTDAGTVWRMLMASYVLVMGVVLVYTGEHYVVDVLAGWATAVTGTVVGGWARRLVEQCSGMTRSG